MKTILFYLSLIFLIGCQAKPEFKLNFQQVLADNNNEILDYGIEKKITWTGDINGDKFTELGHRIKFEKRWVRGKAQWIPCYFQYRKEAISPMKFLPQAYTPAITSTYNKDYLEFTFKFLFKIGSAKQHPFTIGDPLPYDLFRFNNNLDSIEDLDITSAEYPNVPAYEQMSNNAITITQSYTCKNTAKGLIIEALHQPKEQFEELKKLEGIGLVNITENSNFHGLIPNNDSTIASYRIGTKELKGNSASYHSSLHIVSLEEWRLKDIK